MKFGFDVTGFRAEVELSFLQEKALLHIDINALAPPDLCRAKITVLTLVVGVSVTRKQ